MHRPILFGTFLLACLAKFSSAAPSVNTTEVDITDRALKFPHWGRFCTDTDCKEGCGEWIKMTDSGCVSGEGSNSFYVRDGDSGSPLMLVISDDDGCPCQSDCTTNPDLGKAGTCVKLPENKKSWRFVEIGWDGCPANNCP
ncbi:hypothetical protein N7467_002961 [Penicillium canescens]|nr:hypothetical protein N7467_002961 [Penicillium canescens]